MRKINPIAAVTSTPAFCKGITHTMSAKNVGVLLPKNLKNTNTMYKHTLVLFTESQLEDKGTLGNHPAAVSSPSQSNSPSLWAEHDALCCGTSLWPLWISWPGHVPSWLLVHLLTSRAQETESPWLRVSTAQQQPKQLCYLHYSRIKSKTWHCTSY